MLSENTNVVVSIDTWKKLNDLKKSPKDSFDSVIRRLLPFSGPIPHICPLLTECEDKHSESGEEGVFECGHPTPGDYQDCTIFSEWFWSRVEDKTDKEEE